jgi:hypothetical protein
LATTPPLANYGERSQQSRLDATGLDEISQRGFADPHMTTDSDELDSPFRDQAPGSGVGGPARPHARPTWR